MTMNQSHTTPHLTEQKLIDYRTRRELSQIKPGNAALNQWCEAFGYLPHTKLSNGWLVIKYENM